jgi:hypothetical protein
LDTHGRHAECEQDGHVTFCLNLVVYLSVQIGHSILKLDVSIHSSSEFVFKTNTLLAKHCIEFTQMASVSFEFDENGELELVLAFKNTSLNDEIKKDVKAETVENPMNSTILKVVDVISQTTNPKIVLLKQKEVIQWLFGDLSFLPTIEHKNKTSDESKLKVLEDTWGQTMLKTRRPDLKLDKQWTNKFGEHLCEELYTLLGKEVTKPKKKLNYQPDSEIDDAILEAKAGTYFTGGTAGEKILGSPFKYAEIPTLYGKPLRILCMGGAEKLCREQYGNLDGAKCTPQKKKFIEFFKENQIEYVGATDILKSLVDLKQVPPLSPSPVSSNESHDDTTQVPSHTAE